MQIKRFDKLEFENKKELVKYLNLKDEYPLMAVTRITNNEWLWRIWISDLNILLSTNNINNDRLLQIFNHCYEKASNIWSNFISTDNDVIYEVGKFSGEHVCCPVNNRNITRWVFRRKRYISKNKEYVQFLGCYKIKNIEHLDDDICKITWSWDGAEICSLKGEE